MPRAHGWDVSHWNAPTLPDLPYRFLIAKATEGTAYADTAFLRWRAAAAHAGKLFGSYHFARPDLGHDATAEADWFCNVADPKPGELVVLDIEVHSASPGDWVNTWCTRVAQRTKARPIVYTNLSVGNTLAGCGHHPLWIADPSSRAGSPRLPSPWASWVLHQFGSVGGYDRDIAASTLESTLLPLIVPHPGVTPPPVPTPHVRRVNLIRRIRVLLTRLRGVS